ncbi:MAG: aldehyde dehydrogenase family protein [Chloroflexi bacterium]|nr:aldehyde dehydrogenase family protein [Chloroflexota bacterium]
MVAVETQRRADILSTLGIEVGGSVSGVAYAGAFEEGHGEILETFDPTTGQLLACVQTPNQADYDRAVEAAREAFVRWRTVPAPRRGEIVRQLGNLFRERKEDLARLISLENGKILSEARGEVQEVIDVCDFAVGLSRQLYGREMHSERAEHRLFEQWHPLGVVGIISAFNFPVAVPGWGWAIALTCGDSILWKPSELTPLISIAAQRVFQQVTNGTEAEGIFSLVVGPGATTGEALINDPRIPLIQATGSCRMGQRVAEVVGKRTGRAILELGGNNAVIVLDDADLDLALRAVVFGAVGTAGQRCTSTRRLILQRGIAPTFVDRLVHAYGSVSIGDPLDGRTLMGPLISARAVDGFRDGMDEIRRQGGNVLYGGRVLDLQPGGYFVEPTIVRSHASMPVCAEEIFAPILHAFEVASLDEAVELNNAVPQGLSSSLFTRDLRAASEWLSARGSDCGIANVNVGTSGAEIGGAFGGEKATGGGRQAGSDAWKAYMRRQTCTVNYGSGLPLAQGVRFEVG